LAAFAPSLIFGHSVKNETMTKLMRKFLHLGFPYNLFISGRQTQRKKLALDDLTTHIFRHKAILAIFLLLLVSSSSIAQNWDQVIKASASDRAWRYQPDREANDYFGASVAIDGNYAIVGAYLQEDAGGTTPFQGGTALLFKKNASGQWLFLKKLKPADLAGNDNFGYSVAINGNTIVIGAINEDEDAAGGATLASAGSAYIFSKDQGGTDNWGQVKKIVASDRSADDQFGNSVSISGNYIVVGAPKEDEDASGGATDPDAGSAYVFYKDQGGTNNWGEVKKIVPSDRLGSDQFGNSVSISGSNIVVGAWGQDSDAAGANSLQQAGAAYVFSKDAGGTDNWGQVKKTGRFRQSR
jgi:hypothetical protein